MDLSNNSSFVDKFPRENANEIALQNSTNTILSSVQLFLDYRRKYRISKELSMKIIKEDKRLSIHGEETLWKAIKWN